MTRSQAKSGSSTESNDDEHFEDDKSLFNEQIRDPLIGRLITWKLDNDRPDWQNISAESTELKYYWSRFDPLEIKNDILYHKFENDVGDKITWQIVMPTKLRKTVLKQLHDVPIAVHLGVKKTLMKVRSRYFWLGLRRDVENWISKCDVCASRKPHIESRKPL